MPLKYEIIVNYSIHQYPMLFCSIRSCLCTVVDKLRGKYHQLSMILARFSTLQLSNSACSQSMFFFRVGGPPLVMFQHYHWIILLGVITSGSSTGYLIWSVPGPLFDLSGGITVLARDHMGGRKYGPLVGCFRNVYSSPKMDGSIMFCSIIIIVI